MSIMALTVTLDIDDADSNAVDKELKELIRLLSSANIEFVENIHPNVLTELAKGDAVTFAAVVLGVTTATIPVLINFIQNWLVERRKISIEAPNGTKATFVSSKKLTENEILDFIKRMSASSEGGK